MSPERDHPYSLFAAANYLLNRGEDRDRVVEAVLAFSRVEKVKGYGGNPYSGDFALLALEFIPDHALELCRRGLRSSVPLARDAVVAVLASLSEDWCWQELLAALEDTQDLGQASSLLAGLCGAPEGIQARTEAWKRAHPPAPHAGPGFTWAEVSLANAESWHSNEKERRKALVARLKARTTTARR